MPLGLREGLEGGVGLLAVVRHHTLKSMFLVQTAVGYLFK